MSSDNPPSSDHDILIRNTALTEETHRRVSEALQQLGRGNERFQAMDARILALESRLGQLEQTLPNVEVVLRGDMLRAIGSMHDRSQEILEAAVKPLKEDLAPVKATIDQIHNIVKWTLTSLGGVAVALVIAYLTRVLFPS